MFICTAAMFSLSKMSLLGGSFPKFDILLSCDCTAIQCPICVYVSAHNSTRVDPPSILSTSLCSYVSLQCFLSAKCLFRRIFFYVLQSLMQVRHSVQYCIVVSQSKAQSTCNQVTTLVGVPARIKIGMPVQYGSSASGPRKESALACVVVPLAICRFRCQ